MDVILEFFKNLDWGTIAANAFVVFLFLSKPFITKVSERSAELVTAKQKTQIEESVKQGFNESLAKYKNELDIDKSEYLYNYSYFYNERAKIIEELYRQMVLFFSEARLTTRPIKPGTTIDEELLNEKKNHKKKFDKLIDEFNSYLGVKQIFFNKKLLEDLQDFYMRIDRYIETYAQYLETADINDESIKNLNSYSYQINVIENENLEKFANILRELICPPRESKNRPSTNLDKVEKPESEATSV